MGIGEIGNLLIAAACTIQIRLKVTRNMGMVCVFLSLRNIMKMHDCRKRQVEIERQRNRKAAKQEEKGKKQGSRTERSKKSREAEKQEKNKIAEKQEKHTSREQKSKHAEKQRSRKAEKQEQKKFKNPKKIPEPAQKKPKINSPP